MRSKGGLTSTILPSSWNTIPSVLAAMYLRKRSAASRASLIAKRCGVTLEISM